MKFVVIGCLSAAAHIGVAALLVESFGLNPQPSNIVGFLTSVLVSFTGNHYWSFHLLEIIIGVSVETIR